MRRTLVVLIARLQVQTPAPPVSPQDEAPADGPVGWLHSITLARAGLCLSIRHRMRGWAGLAVTRAANWL